MWPTNCIGDLSFNVIFLWHVRRENSAKFTQLSMQPIDHVWPVLAIIRVHSHIRNSIQSSTAQSLRVNPYQFSALGIVARLLDIDTDFSLCQVLRDDHAGDSMIDIAIDVVWRQIQVVGVTLNIELPEAPPEITKLPKSIAWFLGVRANLSIPPARAFQHLEQRRYR